jgi:hypothetical protein
MALMGKDGDTHSYIAPQDRERVAGGAPVTSLPHRGHWVGPRQTARGTEYPVFDHTGTNIVDWTLDVPPSLTQTAKTAAEEWAERRNRGLQHTPESNLPKLPKRDNDVDTLPKHALKVVQAVVDHYPTTLEERTALNKAYAALLMIDQRTSAK